MLLRPKLAHHMRMTVCTHRKMSAAQGSAKEAANALTSKPTVLARDRSRWGEA